jgi:hypothetical protein
VYCHGFVTVLASVFYIQLACQSPGVGRSIGTPFHAAVRSRFADPPEIPCRFGV